MRGHLGQTIGAGVVIVARQQHFGTKSLTGFDNACIVGGNHHAFGAALARLLPDQLNHGFAGNGFQRLARKAARAVARAE